MTIQTDSRQTSEMLTDGAAKTFSFDFPVFNSVDGEKGVEVRFVNELGYDVVEPSDYLVIQDSDNTGGIVQFHLAPPTDKRLMIVGKTPLDQQLDITNYSRFHGESIETNFDKIVAICQEFVSKIDEETRQRINNDEALKSNLNSLFTQLATDIDARFNGKWTEIADYLNRTLPMFFCIMRKEIDAYAKTGLIDVINAALDEKGLSNLVDEYINSLDGSFLNNTKYFSGAFEFDPDFIAAGGKYPLNTKLRLTNGDVVKSTVANNITDPNIDMTGWVKTSDAKQLKYSYTSDRLERSIHDRLTESVSIKDFGAIGDGTLHTVNEWVLSGRYSNIAEIKVDFPHVTSLTDSIDWAAAQAAVNANHSDKINNPDGVYVFGSKTLKITRSNITLIGDGAADAPTSVYQFTPNIVGFKGIDADAYGVSLDGLSLETTTGVNDGFGSIGFYHVQSKLGSTGRIRHRDSRISGFSKHAMRIGLGINYQIDNVTMQGGEDVLWIGKGFNDLVTTTISLNHVYLTGGKRSNLYLDRVADFAAHRLILEYGGSAAYPDSAALYTVGTSPLSLYDCYWEANYRNVNTDLPYLNIGDNTGAAQQPDIENYNPAMADTDKGKVKIGLNSITLRKIIADTFKNQIEFWGNTVFENFARFKARLQANEVIVGSDADLGRIDGLKLVAINSNMSGAPNVNVVGQEFRFGVTNSSVGIASKWLVLGHRRLDNTNTALGFYVNSGTTSFAPDGVPVKLGEWNSKLGLVLAPKALATPEINGEMTFELVSNTLVKLKLRGSDGKLYGHDLIFTEIV